MNGEIKLAPMTNSDLREMADEALIEAYKQNNSNSHIKQAESELAYACNLGRIANSLETLVEIVNNINTSVDRSQK
jgi:hypothetical protein